MHKEILTKEQVDLLPLLGKFSKDFGMVGGIKIPDLVTLAAMKAFALGMRSKWKDYIDLYFIIGDHYPISGIVEKADEIFGSEFNEKLFRGQLAYFKDIDYSEEVFFMPGFEKSDEEIKKGLIEFSLQ